MTVYGIVWAADFVGIACDGESVPTVVRVTPPATVFRRF